MFNEGTVLLSCYKRILVIFFVESTYIVRRVMEARESWTPCFFVSIPTIKYYRT